MQQQLQQGATSMGRLEICQADMSVPGAYDEIFKDCFAVCHVAGNFGTDPSWQRQQQQQQPNQDQSQPPRLLSYNQGVYNSYVVSMRYILDSIDRNRATIRRLIYTSSQCTGPTISQQESVYETPDDNAYGKGKEDCERMIYEFGRKNRNIICASSVPCEVLGPILAPIHDCVYPHRLGDILAGHWTLSEDCYDDPMWNIVDVRDVAETQRLLLEYPHLVNGARFYNGPVDSEDAITGRQLLELLQSEFPQHYKGPTISRSDDEYVDDGDRDDVNESDNNATEDQEDENDEESVSPSASASSSYGESEWNEQQTTTWSNPYDVLGLRRHRQSVHDTIRDTIQSLLQQGVVDRSLTTQELRDYYKVAEMDGEEAEMEYLSNELVKRNENL